MRKYGEEFEAWIDGDWKGVRLVRNPENAAMFAGQYQEGRVHMAWKAWQASRAAIEVESSSALVIHPFKLIALPPSLMQHHALPELEYALECVGVKVKS